MYWRALHTLRRVLRGPGASQDFNPAQQRAAFVQAQMLVRAYYILMLVVAFRTSNEVFALVMANDVSTPQWPVIWISLTDPVAATRVLLLGFLASVCLGVIMPHRWWVRGAIFTFLLMVSSLRMSFGYVHHDLHLFLWLSLAFVFFPLGRSVPVGDLPRPAIRHGALSAFFAAQAMIAMFYTLSGLWKVLRGVIVPPDAISSFSPDALAVLTAQRWIHNSHETLLQGWFEGSLWVGWPAHLFVMYIELFMLVAIFRPEMHRAFGIALMIFHLMVWALIGIEFPYQPATMALIFVLSPMAVGRTVTFRRFCTQVPLFGDLWTLIIGLRRRHHPRAPAMEGTAP